MRKIAGMKAPLFGGRLSSSLSRCTTVASARFEGFDDLRRLLRRLRQQSVQICPAAQTIPLPWLYADLREPAHIACLYHVTSWKSPA